MPGVPKTKSPLDRNSRNDFRISESDRKRRDHEGEIPPTVRRSLHRTIAVLVGNCGSNANKSSERADQRRSRQKVRQAGIDPVVPAGQVMPHLMGQQDR